jgi:hypothetical protein
VNVIGIDPGVSTGVAYFEDGKLRRLDTIAPWDIPTMLRGRAGEPLRVVFEDSRLQSHTWTKAASRAAAAKMARNVGEIDAWCKLILGTCDWLQIPAHGISPAGKGAKVDAAAFGRITGWTDTSNQHERDAAMVAWQYRGARA